MPNNKLTKQQEKFVQELIKGNSQRQAYRIAYPTSIKWADEIVDSKASELLNKNGKVLVRYNKLTERLKKEAEDECIVESKDVLRELKTIGFSKITDYAEICNNKLFIYNTADISEEKISAISEIKETQNGLQFKLHNKVTALENIARMLGMFNDSININMSKPVEETISEIDEYIRKRKNDDNA